MEQEVHILEDVVGMAHVEVIRAKYLKEALMTGPEIYYKAILKHEPNHPLNKYDLLIMSFLSCTLINEIHMEVINEIIATQQEEPDDRMVERHMLLMMSRTLAENGAQWIRQNREMIMPKTDGSVFSLGRSYPTIKQDAIQRSQDTMNLLVKPLTELLVFLDSSGTEDLIPCHPYIKLQINFFYQYFEQLKQEKKIVLPEWKNERVTNGAEWLWRHQIGIPWMPINLKEIAMMMACCNNIIVELVTAMMDHMSVIIDAEEDRVTEELIGLFTSCLEFCDHYSKEVTSHQDMRSNQESSWDQMNTLMKYQLEHTLPTLSKISKTITELGLDKYFPPQPIRQG